MKNDPMKVKYNAGGSMLVPPERQQYSAGSKVIGLIVKAVQKSKSVQKGKGPKRSIIFLITLHYFISFLLILMHLKMILY